MTGTWSRIEASGAHAIRAMDAWHQAAALLIMRPLAEPGEEIGFATRDEAQARVATELGLTPM